MPGTFGNKNATKEKRLIGDMLKRVATQNPKRLRAACLKLLQRAEEGDIAAFNTLADRVDGKLMNPVDLTSNGMTLEQLVAAASEPEKKE